MPEAITQREAQEQRAQREREEIRDEALRADNPALGAGVGAAIAAHEAAADPHPTYTTAAELAAAVNAAIAAIVAAAPATLDTLDELAAALGDDPNFATTVMAAIGAKQVAIQFKDEGGNVGASGAITAVDFVGAGVTATVVGTVLTVTISGGGGAGSIDPRDSWLFG